MQSNTYLVPERSPYIINGPTTIPPGVLLKIEAGVKVIFTQPTSSLIVSGRNTFFIIILFIAYFILINVIHNNDIK